MMPRKYAVRMVETHLSLGPRTEPFTKSLAVLWTFCTKYAKCQQSTLLARLGKHGSSAESRAVRFHHAKMKSKYSRAHYKMPGPLVCGHSRCFVLSDLTQDAYSVPARYVAALTKPAQLLDDRIECRDRSFADTPGVFVVYGRCCRFRQHRRSRQPRYLSLRYDSTNGTPR